jgi:hypothetical protein
MNANALWAGSDYALVESRGRNDAFNMNAQRVRVKKVFKTMQGTRDRARTMVQVFLINDDGTEHKDFYSGEAIIKEVRARDIVDHWDQYEEERAHYVAESKKREEAELERQRENTNRKVAILDALEERGIPRTAVTVSGASVYINRYTVERWLGLNGS